MTLILLSGAVMASVFLTGGVYPAQWNWCLLVIALAAVTANLRKLKSDRRPPILLAIIGGIAVVQIIPLPAVLVGLLSPTRLELAQAVSTIAAPVPNFLTLSAAPYRSGQQVLTLSGYGLVLLLIRAIAPAHKSPWIAVWPLLTIGAMEALLGTFQTHFARGTYVNSDHFAGLLEMILPFAVMYPIAILKRDSSRRESSVKPVLEACALFAIAALMLVAVLNSLSRMGFVASLVALFVCGCLLLSVRWGIPVMGVGIVLALIYLPGDSLIARFSTVRDVTRMQIWQDTLGLVKAFPVFGCGLGAFESCFMRYQTVAPMNTVDYAHNDYLQILAELGPIALVAGLLFASRLLGATVRTSTHASSVDHRLLAIACTASLVAMLLHSFVDFNLYIPANGALFAWICGIAASCWDSRMEGY